MGNTVVTQSATEERGLARVAQKMAAWTEKWFPDAYIFALAGVVIIAVAALAIALHRSPSPIPSAMASGT